MAHISNIVSSPGHTWPLKGVTYGLYLYEHQTEHLMATEVAHDVRTDDDLRIFHGMGTL